MAQVLIGVMAMVVAFFGVGCTDPEPTADPPGTVTTDLRDSADLGANGINFETGATGAVGRPGDSFGSQADLYLAQGNWHGSLVDVGALTGVGDVELVAGASFVESMSAIVGHGYLVQTREGNAYGMFVVDDIVGTSGGIIGKRIAWVPLRVLQSVELTPTNATLAAGQTAQFTLTAQYSDGSSEDAASNMAVAWGASDPLTSGPCVAEIDTSGLVTANVAGTATITAAIHNTQVTAPVNRGCATTATGDFAASVTVTVE